MEIGVASLLTKNCSTLDPKITIKIFNNENITSKWLLSHNEDRASGIWETKNEEEQTSLIHSILYVNPICCILLLLYQSPQRMLHEWHTISPA